VNEIFTVVLAGTSITYQSGSSNRKPVTQGRWKRHDVLRLFSLSFLALVMEPRFKAGNGIPEP